MKDETNRTTPSTIDAVHVKQSRNDLCVLYDDRYSTNININK